MRPAPAVTARTLERRPEPASFWVRYRPEPWAAAGGRWVDLASGRLGRALPAVPVVEPARLPDGALDDTWYLPPVRTEAQGARDRWVAELLAADVPVVVQLLAGEAWRAGGGTPVVDLTESLFRRGLEALPEAPSGAWALWPLVRGVTDEAATVETGCARLARLGFAGVHGVVLELTPEERRRLAESLGEEAFHPLFHGGRPAERAFCRAAAAAGLAALPPRPLPRGDARLARNREVAGQLLLLGDLWLRLGRPAHEAHDLFRAARWIDGGSHDVEALAREGNLEVVPQLGARGRELVAERVRRGRMAALDEAVATYLHGQGVGEP